MPRPVKHNQTCVLRALSWGVRERMLIATNPFNDCKYALLDICILLSVRFPWVGLLCGSSDRNRYAGVCISGIALSPQQPRQANPIRVLPP